MAEVIGDGSPSTEPGGVNGKANRGMWVDWVSPFVSTQLIARDNLVSMHRTQA